MPVPPAPKLLSRNLLSEDVYDSLLNEIVGGLLTPGMVLSEPDLERRMGASRTPVRDALHRLSLIGLVDIIPQKETRVALIDINGLTEALDLAAWVYEFVVRESVPLLDNEAVAQIRQYVQSVADDRSVEADAIRNGRAFREFLGVYLTAYNNPAFSEVLSALNLHVRRAIAVTPHPDRLMLGDATALDQLVAATQAGDSEAAATAMRNYFEKAAEHFLDQVRQSLSPDLQTPARPTDAQELPTRRERKLLRNQVYEALLAAIIDGTFRPEERLREDELMVWLGVSATPVREALNMLRRRGIVESVPGKYTRVAPIDFAAVNAAIGAIGVFYEYAVRRAVPMLSDKDRAAITEILHKVQTAGATDDRLAMQNASYDYFLAYAQVTGNQTLIQSMEGQMPALARGLLDRPGLESMASVAASITAVHEAAMAGEAVLASDRVHQLNEPTRRNFLELYRTPVAP